MTLTPAYGRDYKGKTAALFDFDAGLDFVIEPSGQYANKSDLLNLGITEVTLRYNKLRNVAVIKVQSVAA